MSYLQDLYNVMQYKTYKGCVYEVVKGGYMFRDTFYTNEGEIKDRIDAGFTSLQQSINRKKEAA